MAKQFSNKLSKSHIIPLLLQYKKYPCLWNPDDKNYKNHDNRVPILKKISHDLRLGMTVGQLRTRIKNLRTTYVREVNRIIRSRKTPEVHRPRLAWFKVADSFLRNVVVRRRVDTDTESNESVSEETELSVEHIERFEDNSYGNAEVEIEEIIVKQEDAQEAFNHFNVVSIESTGNLEESTSNCAKSETRNRNWNYIMEYGQKNANSSNNLHGTPEVGSCKIQEDEFDTFGRHVANQLRCLPLREAVKTQNFIHNYLMDERLKFLENAS